MQLLRGRRKTQYEKYSAWMEEWREEEIKEEAEKIFKDFLRYYCNIMQAFQ